MGAGNAAETARWLGVACEEEDETEAAAPPARTTVRAMIRMVSFMGIFSWLEFGNSSTKGLLVTIGW
jgi:hypothetical protein